MKSSLISKKNLVPGKSYWCIYNNDSVLWRMKNINNDMFEGHGILESMQNFRVMYEGYVNIDRSRIPAHFLVPQRHYWCSYVETDKLSLMRYESKNRFYSIPHDVFCDSTTANVIFEDYER